MDALEVQRVYAINGSEPVSPLGDYFERVLHEFNLDMINWGWMWLECMGVPRMYTTHSQFWMKQILFDIFMHSYRMSMFEKESIKWRGKHIDANDKSAFGFRIRESVWTENPQSI